MSTAGLAARVVTRTVTAPRTYSPASYAATAVPTARELHLMNRMGYGFTPQTLAEMRAAGGELAWFEQQLDPFGVPETAEAVAAQAWFADLALPPLVLRKNASDGVKRGWEVAKDLSNLTLLRRIHSRRTVHESLVELWSNHLHVDANHGTAYAFRPSYDAVIRTHALGRYEDLLVAATLHPAMLVFLDNHRSVKGAPNENHGRELLELHTVGREAGYTEAMVRDSATILSGHTVHWETATGVYDPSRHTTGRVQVLGFGHANAVPDGGRLAEDYLRYLARHPATARRVAGRLCRRFVSDSPSEALVDRVATAYLRSGTDIKETLRAVVASEEFWASAGLKVRTPSDDVVATCRVLGVTPLAPTTPGSFAHQVSWLMESTLVHHWPRPDGLPDDAGAWSSTTRMLNSWRAHWNLAGGTWPRERVRYRKPASFLPAKRIRFDELVDHLCRSVLGRPSTARLLKAACEGLDVRPEQVVTRKHPVASWQMQRLLAVLLDSPAHLTR